MWHWVFIPPHPTKMPMYNGNASTFEQAEKDIRICAIHFLESGL